MSLAMRTLLFSKRLFLQFEKILMPLSNKRASRAKAAGLKPADITSAVAKARGRNEKFLACALAIFQVKFFSGTSVYLKLSGYQSIEVLKPRRVYG